MGSAHGSPKSRRDASVRLIGAIAVLVLVPLIVMALHGSSSWLARKLVRRAARRPPGPYADRYEEEWLAELDAMPDGGLATLAFTFFIRIRIGSMERRLGLLTSHSRPDDESDANGQNLELLQEITHIKVKNRSDLTVDNLVILSREANWKLSHPRSKLLGGNPGISLPSRRRHKKRRRPS
jgi:hypothetical protein